MMPLQSRAPVCAALAISLCLFLSIGRASAQDQEAPTGQPEATAQFTAKQAERGKAAYGENCARCHGAHLDDGQFASAVTGKQFESFWAGRSVGDLYSYISANMPPSAVGSLGSETYADVVAFLLQADGVKPGKHKLPVAADALAAMKMPGEPLSEQARIRQSPVGPLTPGVPLPDWPAPPNPLSQYTPVTKALLDNPPPSDWLMWRRSRNETGFSPLKDINRRTVKSLQLAWSLALPLGTNESEPLVHDGVLFVYAPSDNVFALDATNGNELWHYSRTMPKGVAKGPKKNMALLGNRLYLGTTDVHVVALDVKTGHVVWDTAIGNPKDGFAISGGPIIADGKVIEGVGGQGKGGGYVQALDAQTGAKVWRFNSIPHPGEAGNNTWNDIPIDERTGGSVWTAGSYDPQLNLVFVGPAPTYDTGPMRDPVGKPGYNNDALYTDTTVALDADTGKVIWHYQHVKNDQWDLDWAFEREIIHLPVDGQTKKLVVTGGKPGVFDALDAATGKYAFSFDMGIQTLISAIDPKTGAKTIDPALVPSRKKSVMVCPHGGGGRNWIPTSYDADTKMLYIPAEETCMDLTPVGVGGRGFLSTGVSVSLRAPPHSDGRFGRIQAVNLETRKTVWTDRQRAPQSTGVLATAGGVLFAGAIDRYFTAYDSANGKELWRTRLSDIANAPPISYSVNGRQYVAIVAGYGAAQASTFPAMTPEIPLPVTRNSAIWVFALPDKSKTAPFWKRW